MIFAVSLVKKSGTSNPMKTRLYRIGDVWTFCAVDRQTKAVPCFKVGKRDRATAHAFAGFPSFIGLLFVRALS